MAREYARIRLSRAQDDDWRDLTPGAQHLYDTLATSEDLSYCGRVDWRPARLLPRARDWTLDQITTAAAELEAARFVLFDPDTEEALVRSLIRADELMRNPKLALAVVKAYGSLASRTLRAAVVTELRRNRDEHPEYSSWSHSMCAPQVERLLSLPDLEAVGYTNRITNPIADPARVSVPPSTLVITNPISNQIGNRITNGISNDDSVENPNAERSELPIPTQDPNVQVIGNPDRSVSYPQTAYSRQQPNGGYVTGERYEADANASERKDPPPKHHPGHEDGYVDGCPDCERDYRREERRLALTLAAAEPAPYCDRHPGGTDAPCRDCGVKRAENAQWHADRRHAEALAQSEAARAAAEDRARAIANCPLCDADGYAGRALCDHDPETADRNRRGAEIARAALRDARAAKEARPA